jgi:hypothetical protein
MRLVKWTILSSIFSIAGCAYLRGYDWRVRVTSEPDGADIFVQRVDGTMRSSGKAPVEVPVAGTGDLPVVARIGDRLLGYRIESKTEVFNISATSPRPLADFSDKQSREAFDIVISGKIQRGFSKDLVVWAWGRPSSTSSHSFGAGTTEIWTYNRRESYGIATAWQRH